jgi:phosphoribosylanthranilate isomerase
MVKVKICGITSLQDAAAILKLKPDALGFVFYKNSPRYITFPKAKTIIDRLPSSVKKVGVFVNDEERNIRFIAGGLKLDMLQFHGSESAEFCGRFRDYRIVKALRVKDKHSLQGIKTYPVWGVMFDAYKKNFFGGTGTQFNWNLIKDIKLTGKEIFLSGGLSAGDVKAAISLVRPDWVDVSSSVEIRPGKKDYRLVKEFIEAVRK